MIRFHAIGMMRGDEFHAVGRTDPSSLVVIFHNYALEGANLTNVHVGYDSMQGNNLTFGVQSSYGRADMNPAVRAMTSMHGHRNLPKTKLRDTKRSLFQGRGWRMAVILNGTIISKPHFARSIARWRYDQRSFLTA